MNSTDVAANRTKSEEANRNLTSIRPSFIVKDLQASIAYYLERLGFQLDFQGPDDGPYYAGVSRDGIGIMLKAIAARRAALSKPHPARMGPLGRVHLHHGPRCALRRVQPARCVVREDVVVHRRGAVGLRDHRCRRVCPCLLSAPQPVGRITDYLYGRKQDQAHRRQRRGLHRLESQRAATHRLPGVDGSAQESHPALTKNVGTQHRRLWLLPVHLREWTNLGKPLWRALPSVAENWWSTWWPKERSKDPCCPSLASTGWARFACTSSSLLIFTGRRSKSSSSVRSRR